MPTILYWARKAKNSLNMKLHKDIKRPMLYITDKKNQQVISYGFLSANIYIIINKVNKK